MSNRTIYLMGGADQSGQNDFRVRYSPAAENDQGEEPNRDWLL